MIAIVRLLYCSVSDNIFVTCITVRIVIPLYKCYSNVLIIYNKSIIITQNSSHYTSITMKKYCTFRH